MQPGGPAHYEKGSKTGNLYKRGKDNKTYRIRKFVLDATAGTLKYFIKPDVNNNTISSKIIFVKQNFL